MFLSWTTKYHVRKRTALTNVLNIAGSKTAIVGKPQQLWKIKLVEDREFGDFLQIEVLSSSLFITIQND